MPILSAERATITLGILRSEQQRERVETGSVKTGTELPLRARPDGTGNA